MDDGEVGMEGHSANIMDVKLGRHAVPDPSDGEVRCTAASKFQTSLTWFFLALPPQVFKFSRSRTKDL